MCWIPPQKIINSKLAHGQLRPIPLMTTDWVVNRRGKDAPNNGTKLSKQKGQHMKKIVITAVLGAIALASHAASLNVVEVGLPGINCLFNTNCTNNAEEKLTPVTISGTTGTGYVHSRVLRGERGSTAGGHYGYEWQVDLSGIITSPTNPVVLTNIVKCETKRVEVRTNSVVCRTNVAGGSNTVVCTTNVLPATNLVLCVTNVTGGSNSVVCTTNGTITTCVTNRIGGTTNIVCTTNHFNAATNVVCVTNTVGGSNAVVVCTTNRTSYYTNILVCTTNTTTVRGTPGCVSSLRIPIGSAVARLDLNDDGTNTDNVYLVTSGGTGSSSPSAVVWDDDDLVVTFNPPLCAGDTSLAFGIVARSAPRDVSAKIKYTSGSSRSVKVLGPGGTSAFLCSFDALTSAIEDLKTKHFTGRNDSVREERRDALLELLALASEAAYSDNLDDVADAFGEFLSKVDGRGNDWVTDDGRKKLKDEIKDLRKCLEKAQEEADRRDRHGNHDDDDDEDCKD
jgi:hypothetical protein